MSYDAKCAAQQHSTMMPGGSHNPGGERSAALTSSNARHCLFAQPFSLRRRSLVYGVILDVATATLVSRRLGMIAAAPVGHRGGGRRRFVFAGGEVRAQF